MCFAIRKKFLTATSDWSLKRLVVSKEGSGSLQYDEHDTCNRIQNMWSEIRCVPANNHYTFRKTENTAVRKRTGNACAYKLKIYSSNSKKILKRLDANACLHIKSHLVWYPTEASLVSARVLLFEVYWEAYYEYIQNKICSLAKSFHDQYEKLMAWI